MMNEKVEEEEALKLHYVITTDYPDLLLISALEQSDELIISKISRNHNTLKSLCDLYFDEE